MKWSRYNLLFQTTKRECLLYNSLSNAFVLLDQDVYANLEKFKHKRCVKEEDVSEELGFSFSEMVDMKILTQSDEEELLKIKFSRRRLRFQGDVLVLTINPTLDCNFSCDYCFEGEKIKGVMTKRTCDNVLRFVKGYQNVKSVDITWFGGEPLLAPKVIEYITKGIKEHQLTLNAEIITNGYLLSPHIVQKLKEWDVRFLQITVDGPPVVHDQRRPLKNGKGTFEMIVKNIDYVLGNTEFVFISIRVNIDKRNENVFVEIYNFLLDRYTKFVRENRLNIYPGFVEFSPVCPSIGDCVFSRENKQKFLFDTFEKSGVVAFPFYPSAIEAECAVRNINSFVIGPQGEIYKCWNDVGQDERVIANINKMALRNDKIHLDYLTGADPLENRDCLKCFLLPVCAGGCPYQRLMARNNEDLKKCCILQKDSLQEFLEKHYNIKKLHLIKN